MRRILAPIALIVMILSLGACASGPKFNTMNINNATRNPEMGRLFLYRITGFAGSAVQPDILLMAKR
jgi:hypothetical protein